MVNFRWLGSDAYYNTVFRANVAGGGYQYYDTSTTAPSNYLIAPGNKTAYQIPASQSLIWTPASSNWYAGNTSRTWNVQGQEVYSYFNVPANTLVFANGGPDVYNPSYDGVWWNGTQNPYGYLNNLPKPFLSLQNFLRTGIELYSTLGTYYPLNDSSNTQRFTEWQYYFKFRDSTNTSSPYYQDINILSVRLARRNAWSQTIFWSTYNYAGYQLIEVSWQKAPYTLGFNDPSYAWTATGLNTSSFKFYPSGYSGNSSYVPINLSPVAAINGQSMVFAAAWGPPQSNASINYYNFYNYHTFNFN